MRSDPNLENKTEQKGDQSNQKEGDIEVKCKKKTHPNDISSPVQAINAKNNEKKKDELHLPAL